MRIAMTLALAGCAESESGARAFVATVGDTFLAVVGGADSGLAYVCDGTPAEAGVSAWFSGPIEGDDFALVGPAGTVSGTFGDQADGEWVGIDEARLPFSASPVDPEADDVGLFRAEGALDGAAVVAGWILAPSGEQRGAVGLSTSSTLFGVVALAPGAAQATLEVDGATIEVDVINAAAQFAE